MNLRIAFVSSLVVGIVAVSAGESIATSPPFKPWTGASVLRDPEWQKRFLGSYGFLSGAEPQINPSELDVLRETIDVMKASPRAAASILERRTTAESSAAFDFILANLRFQNGDMAEAVTSYESALRKFPDFRRARKNLGLLMVQMNEFDGAIEQLTRAIELGDRDGRTYGLLGYCYVNHDNPVAAEQAYRTAVLQQPNSKDWQLGLARSFLAQQKNREAVALFSSFLKKNPRNASIWKLQANAYIGLEQPRAAAVNLETVRMLGEADTATLELLGDIYMNEGIQDLAKDAYLEAIQLDSKGMQFRTAYRAADLLLRAHAYSQSAEILSSIDQIYQREMDEDETLELMTLKARLARAEGHDEEAAKLLEEIVTRDGTRGEALIELARYHRESGNEQMALLLLERAENLEAYEYQALVEHAQFRVASKDYDEAVVLLRRALRIKTEPRVERFLVRVEAAIRH